VKVYLIGRERIQARVRSGGVVEVDVAADFSSSLLHRLVGVQIQVPGRPDVPCSRKGPVYNDLYCDGLSVNAGLGDVT